MIEEGLLDSGQGHHIVVGIPAGVPFHRSESLAVRPGDAGNACRQYVRATRAVVNHRTRPTDALPASVARAGQIQILLQELEQHQIFGHFDRPHRFAVDLHGNGEDRLTQTSTSLMRSALIGVRSNR